MIVPLGLCAAGLALLVVPVRRSRTAVAEGDHKDPARPGLVVQDGSNAERLPPRVITQALGGLPEKCATFTGRDSELEQLLDLLSPASADAAPVQVFALSGLGGIGKTELALQAAYIARQRGWFPGGVLFVNLFGYDPARRVAPARAHDGLLRALGLPGEQIPPDAQDRARLYGSVLSAYAAHAHPILVVIDNAGSADQAKPLIPPSGAGRALITSRHVLAELNARLIELNPLSTENAVVLIARKLREANGPSDTRAADATAARDLAALCGGLPLALQVTGANLAADQSKSLRQMANALEATDTRLDELKYGDQAVGKAFELSYQALPADQQRLFRLLTVNTGPDISTQAAAAITEQDRRQTRHQLESLSHAHLMKGGGDDERWRMHDLVRLYCEDLGRAGAIADHRTAAEERLMRYYQSATATANKVIWGGTASIPDGGLLNPADAVSWLKSEHTNLTAAVVSGAASHPATAIGIAIPLSVFLGDWRYTDEGLVVSEKAVQIARTLRSLDLEATTIADLAVHLEQVGRAEEALERKTEAVALFRQLTRQDPRRYEADLCRVLANLAFSKVIDDQSALAAAREAVEIGRRWTASHNNPASPDIELAGALNNLGMALSRLGQHSQAVLAEQEAAEIRRIQATQVSPRYEPFLGEVLADLATVLSTAGRDDEALDASEETVAVFRRLAAEDPIARGPDLIRALGQMKNLLTAAGRPADARAAADEASAIQDQISRATSRSWQSGQI